METTELLRRRNTAAVLRNLREHGPGTRADLAKRTGLAKATVGAIVADLEARLAIDESASRSGGRGRPGYRVGLRPGAVLGLGLELNVDYVAGVLLDLSGETHRVEVRATDPGRPHGENEVLALAGELCADLDPATLLTGVTVAVPGLVARDQRTVTWAPNLGWEGSELVDRLEGVLAGRQQSRRVEVLNDANCAALAETRHGAARGFGDALFLTGTVGIGAGIVQDGELVRGHAGFAGEVGHLPIGRRDARCGCGRSGCWEATVGLHAMLELTGVGELETPVRTAEAVAARAEHDAGVRRALAELGDAVGLGLATLANVLDPAVIVLGGYFVPLGEHLLAPARAVLDDRLVSETRVRPSLRFSTLGMHAAALGAAERSLADVLAGRADLGAPP